ncbi:hypothetical protein D3C81_1114420 [compost metagenome]
MTFIVSILLTVSRSVKIIPASSSAGRPLVNLSSMTRYSLISALTNGAVYVFFEVTITSMSVIPCFNSSACTASEGRGVILSIIDRGNVILDSSSRYCTKLSSTNPFAAHSFAIVTTPFFSLSPLWEQLSMLTKVIGYWPFTYLR